MPCLTLRLILVCGTLSLVSCSPALRPVDDSFCVLYLKVVVAKGDGSIVATSGVKKRILANETLYREQCVANGPSK